MKNLNFLLFIIVITLFSCSKKEDNLKPFIGKWQKVQTMGTIKTYIEITKEDNSIIVKEVKPNKVKTYVATYDENNNVLVVDVILLKLNITYLKSKDRILISGQGEYQKIN